MIFKIAIPFFILTLSFTANARVFDLKDKSFATYFGAQGGLSQLGRQAWGDCSTGSATCSTNTSEKFNFSGELGMMFASPKMNLRVGVEFVEPQHQSDVKGSDNSGTQLFTLDSTTRAIIPKATLEIVVDKYSDSAIIFGGSVGYAMVTVENGYAMTPAGSAALSAASYDEKGEGTALEGEGFVGYEFMFSDNVTLLASVNYRYLHVNTLKHQNAVTVIGGTSVAKGDPVTDAFGKNRTLDLGSANLGLTFRFYF